MNASSTDSVCRSPLSPSLRWLGPPLAGLYAAGVALRRCAYARGLKRTGRASVPVISVGNLTAGGTGKTPAVAYLVRGLKERGRKPAVVLRGYGAAAPGTLNDEGQELARGLPNVPIIANPDRQAGAALARRRGADVVVLDDGFQHWALERDFDLVLLDAADPFGGGHRLPWGYLRESPKALARAHAILLTRADSVSADALDALRREMGLFAPDALLGTARHRAVALRSLFDPTTKLDLTSLRGRRVVAACGLAQPECFRTTLRDLGAEVGSMSAYSDHHAYTDAEIQTCRTRAQKAGAEAVVITEKDASKWSHVPGAAGTVPVWVLQIAFEIMDGDEAFWKAIETVAPRT